MAHRAEGMNDIFEHDVLVRGTLTANNLLGNGAIPIGTIILYGGSTAPTGFFLCDGTAKNRTTYAALFAVIGTSFGNGDGTATFNIPNFQDVFPIGVNNWSLGQTSSNSTTDSGNANISDSGHTHAIQSSNTDVQSGSGSSVVSQIVSPTDSSTAVISDAGHTHTFQAPFLAINFIIKYQ